VNECQNVESLVWQSGWGPILDALSRQANKMAQFESTLVTLSFRELFLPNVGV